MNRRLKTTKKGNEEAVLQANITDLLRKCGWITMSTDMMIALKYITPVGRKPTKAESIRRMSFISFSKKTGYTKGQLDMVAIKDPHVIFLEVKSEKGSPSPEQKEILRRTPNSYLVRSIEEVQEIISKRR